jgi:hypothetical protein
MPQLCAEAYGCLDGMWLPTPGYCCLSSITYIGDSRYLDMISINAVIINAHLCSHSEHDIKYEDLESRTLNIGRSNSNTKPTRRSRRKVYPSQKVRDRENLES